MKELNYKNYIIRQRASSKVHYISDVDIEHEKATRNLSPISIHILYYYKCLRLCLYPLQDLNEIQEMLRMVFEVINSCLTHTVHLNANLVHVMLVQREQFEKFRELEQFKHLLQVNKNV